MNLLLILCMTHVVWANKLDIYHIKSVKEFTPPEALPLDSFFGYSATYVADEQRLIIGAPRENITGEVYSCNISDTSCSRLARSADLTPERDSIDHCWFGATVRDYSKSNIVACAPRMTSRQNSEMGMRGQCYIYAKSKGEFKAGVKPPPTTRKSHSEHEMETLGWALDIGFDNTILVGGPGMYNKIGLAAYGSKNNLKLSRIEGSSTKPTVSFNFGFAVAIGYFLQTSKLAFAISSTYGEKGIGQVYIYRYESLGNKASASILNKMDDVNLVGAMFGAALCAANLHNRPGSKAHDLLVGAPTYVENSKYNDGAVYVYLFSGRDKHSITPTLKTIVKSPKNDGSFFGSAIISLGDLNGDGLDEVAIGAPFENNGQGAVYLYSGSDLSSAGLKSVVTWLQRLTPGAKYNSFGSSLTALKDYDDNGCNELAVGAPYKDKVFLYRCLATVQIVDLIVKFPNLQDRTRTDFQFEVCIDIRYKPKPTEIQGELSTDVQITHPDVKLTKPTRGKVYTFKTSLAKKIPEHCESIAITLPKDGDYGTEIGYTISTTLLDSPLEKTDFSGNNVILSDNSITTKTGMEWAAECKNSKECIPELSLTITAGMKDPYVIGSTDMEALTIEVKNTGEVAYDPAVQIAVVGAKVYKPTDYCSKMIDTDIETWECTPKKPLRSESWIIDGFTLELKGLTSKDTELNYNVTIVNSRKTNSIGKFYFKKFTLENDIRHVSVKGSNSYGDIVNMTQDDLLINGKRLEHTYVINNYGTTNFIDLVCDVTLQKEVFIGYSEMPVSYYIDNVDNSLDLSGLENRECVITNNTNKSEMTVQCTITLPKSSNVKVVVYIDITAGSQVYEVVLSRNITLNTTLQLHLPGDLKPLTTRLSTLVTLQSASVELWIIVLAALVGVCLIIILALILYECGLLRRKTKAELEKLKTSVKRQTIRRSMMQQPATEDRLNILERMEEVDEQAVDVQQPHP